MGWLAQSLMLMSYAVLGFAVSVLMPSVAGWETAYANLVGVTLFLTASLINLLIRTVRRESDMLDRLEHLEDLSRLLRGDLERTRRDVARRTPVEDKGVKSEELVSELRVLHTLLDQVMRRQLEAEKRREQEGAAPSPTAASMSVSAHEDREEPLDLEAPDEPPFAVDEAGREPPSMLVAAPREDVFDSEAKGVTGIRSAAPSRQRAPIVMVHDEDQLLSIIRSGLSENRVDLYLQPIVTLPSRKVAHFECFSRVRDENGRVVLPRHYMDMAAESGLIGTLDNLLLFRLIQLLRRLGRRKPALRFFCTLSRHSLEDDEFFPQFIDFMLANQDFTSRLVFEIAQADYDMLRGDVRENLLGLAGRGFGFSLDKVENLESLDRGGLEEAGFGFVKIGQRLLKDSFTEDDMSVLIASLNSRGIDLVASEVERQEEVIGLVDAEVRLAQGYVFGEPALASDFDREL